MSKSIFDKIPKDLMNQSQATFDLYTIKFLRDFFWCKEINMSVKLNLKETFFNLELCR